MSNETTTEVPKLELSGEYTDAVVMTTDVEEECEDQIQNAINNEAIRNKVRVMPDTHWGKGAPIGFTMPYTNRVIPNMVGVDVGCGMEAINLGDTLPLDPAERDQRIRDAVPMGRSVHSGSSVYHVKNDFPWGEINGKLDQFKMTLADRGITRIEENGLTIDLQNKNPFNHYDVDYFKNLCKRVGYDTNRAINSVGTLGGGNHFIEFAQSEATGDYWCVIHSGSRGLGLAVATHWQEKAVEATTTRNVTPENIPDDYQAYVHDDLSPKTEKIRQDFEGEAIQEAFDTISTAKSRLEVSDDSMAYLEGREADGYLIDMLFAQTYASENRKRMAELVANTLGVTPKETIESVHNYIGFEDAIIRKGATPAHDGELAIIPYNMAEGTLVVEGKGNPEWNYSAPHGAGRRMSRRGAFRDLSVDDFENDMEGVHQFNDAEEVLDEAPRAYKDTGPIEHAIQETATPIDHWRPRHNIKADE